MVAPEKVIYSQAEVVSEVTGVDNGAVLEGPLAIEHEKAGAAMEEVFGWLVPGVHEGVEVEHQAVRRAAGLIDLSFHGAIRIGGKESIAFLQGLVTSDVSSLGRGRGQRSAFLTGHGKVRALGRILGLGDLEFLIITDPQTHGTIVEYVFPFSYAGDFTVEDVSDDNRIVSVQGPAARLIMKEICFEPMPDLDENEWFSTIVAGQRATVARHSRTGEPGYDIHVAGSGLKDVWDFVQLKGEFHSLRPVGFRALNELRIEAGMPFYGLDADESNMMLELDMPDAISYTKGCYTGQEAVAMATYRGHVSKKLSGLVLSGESAADRGARIRKDAKDIGYITSSIRSRTMGKTIALGYVKYGHFEPGTEVEVVSGNDEGIPASIAQLPFYQPVMPTS